jgi:hypothetical protein
MFKYYLDELRFQRIKQFCRGTPPYMCTLVPYHEIVQKGHRSISSSMRNNENCT